MIYIKDFIICALATFFFALMFRIPSKALAPASVLGGASYAVFHFCNVYFSLLCGYFLGTLIICVFSEILARVRKMPAIIFITPALIPLVPGVGLYETMRLLVSKDFSPAIAKCMETLASAGVMAIAIAVVPMAIQVYAFTANLTRKK